jgi:hypothetical protein
MKQNNAILSALLAASLCVAMAATLRAQTPSPDSAAAKEATLAFLRAASDGRFDDVKALLTPEAVARGEAAMPGASWGEIVAILGVGGPVAEYAALDPVVTGDTANTLAGVRDVEPARGEGERLFNVSLKRVDGAWKVETIAPTAAAAASGSGDAEATAAEVEEQKRVMLYLATAIASFYVDNNRFPRSVIGSEPDSVSFGVPGAEGSPTFSHSESLLTPVEYITRPFLDEFYSPGGAEVWLSFYSAGGAYAIRSAGPDGDYDIPLKVFQELIQPHPDPSFNPTNAAVPGEKGEVQEFLPYLYDPTNGLRSSGDLLRYYSGKNAK